MNAQLSMFDLPTSRDTLNATSSPGSAAGPTPFGSPDGPMTEPSGPGVALASPSLSLESEPVRPMNVTSGPRGSISSASVVLQQSLVSRLRRQLATDGSTLYSLTWKEKITPAGRSYCQLVASGRRTGGTDCGSWRSPRSCDHKGGVTGAQGSRRKETDYFLADQVTQLMAAWPSPSAMGAGATDLERLEERRRECKERTGNGNGFGLTLDQAAPLLASGPMPSGSPAEMGSGVAPDQEYPRLLTAWPTVTGQDNDQVAGEYATNGTTLGGAVRLSQSQGVLNPALSRWLMGYPKEWDEEAIRAWKQLRKRG